MIHLENINKVYANGDRTVQALADIDLDIRDGEVFGFIGRSGAGKSTLIRLLNLLERPSSGLVRVDDEDITALSEAHLRAYRRRVGMIFQHFNLLRSRTVIDNVCFPLRLSGMPRKQRLERAREMLDLVGLSGQEKKYPAQLSGGQQQRVGIARALANEPRLLLCDEATSALDPQTTQSILELLGDINKRLGLTIVLITHSMEVIRGVCDRVAVLEAGRIVESGDVLDVFLHPQADATRALLAESSVGGGDGWRKMAQGITGRLLRLSFRGDATSHPIISRLSRDLGLELSILQGTVGQIKDTPYGQLVIAVNGSKEQLETLEPALDAAHVHYEELQA